MADSKISALPASTTPLVGTETLPIVQGGVTKKTSIESVLTSVQPSGTVNGVTYLNGSKVLTSGAALNWNGSLLGIGRTPTGMRVEIDGNLGLNTANPPGSNGNGISIYSSNFPRLSFRNPTTGDATSDGLAMYMVGSDFTYDLQESGYQAWRINGSEQMRLISTGLGIGTSSPSASAILDAQSTTKGVRMPNMTTTQKNAIASPAAGLMVFDTTLAKLCVYTGAAWQTITSI